MGQMLRMDGFCVPVPDHWTVEEETLDDAETGREEKAVTLYSPQGGFWSLARHPAADPVELAAAVLSTLKAEYPDCDVESVEETIDRRSLVGFDVNFICLDLTATARVRCISVPAAGYVIFAQAEDREFERIEPALRKLTEKFVRDLPADPTVPADLAAFGTHRADGE